VLFRGRRNNKPATAGILAAALVVLGLASFLRRSSALALWLPSTFCIMAVMYASILALCPARPKEACILWSGAFLLSEFEAAFEWAVYFILFYSRGDADRGPALRYICMAVVFGVFLGIAVVLHFRIARRHFTTRHYSLPHVRTRDAVLALVIVMSTFLISNSAFAFKGSNYALSLGPGVLAVRALVDLAGLILLIVQVVQNREAALRVELAAEDELLRKQYEQYRLFKENDEALSLKYHDLKQRIAVLSAEASAEKRKTYLADIEQTLTTRASENATGNPVLDTLVNSKALDFGKKGGAIIFQSPPGVLRFMDTIDICSLFGNMLDNAMEALALEPAGDKKTIRLLLEMSGGFLRVACENYSPITPAFKDGVPVTNKEDKANHGFGVKSMAAVSLKYHGNITFSAENGWFVVRALLPLVPLQNSPSRAQKSPL
jgi:hypothetical protein